MHTSQQVQVQQTRLQALPEFTVLSDSNTKPTSPNSGGDIPGELRLELQLEGQDSNIDTNSRKSPRSPRKPKSPKSPKTPKSRSKPMVMTHYRMIAKRLLTDA